jgi:protein-tyrosine-phosphatase
MNVLFVCTANICRSPVAEYYLRHLCQRLGLQSIEVESGGILGIIGQPADVVASRLARARGIDMGPHRSRGITGEQLERADEIIVMERRHRAWIQELHPPASSKVLLLRAASESSAADLTDPTGGPPKEYERVFETLFASVEQLALKYRYPR